MEAVDHEEQEVKEEQKKRKQQGIASIDVWRDISQELLNAE